MVRRVINRLKSHELINTGFLSGIATVIGMGSNLVLSKIIAITIGPSGIALISQFKNFITICTTFSTFGIDNGVVKYVAEEKNEKDSLRKLLSNIFFITILASIVTGIVIIILSEYLTIKILDSPDYKYVFILFGITVVLFSANTIIIKIINGLSEIKKFTNIKITNSLFTLFVTAASTYYFGIDGALVSLALSQSIVLIVTIFYLTSFEWFSLKLFSFHIEKDILKKLLEFSIMAIVSSILPLVLKVKIRNYIIAHFDIYNAGYWDALFSISTVYMSIFSMVLITYYLPKLSELKEKELIRKEILSGYKLILPFTFFAFIIIYCCKGLVVHILYSSNFLIIKDYFGYMLVGDFLKIASFLLSFLMIAKAEIKKFFILETIFSIIIYALSILFMKLNGFIGIYEVYPIIYFLYLSTLIFMYKDYLIANKK